jgi:hypothetical protein
MIVDGYSYENIQQELGLSRPTFNPYLPFYPYPQFVFREDRKVLEKENSDKVVSSETMELTLAELAELTTDPAVDIVGFGAC